MTNIVKHTVKIFLVKHVNLKKKLEVITNITQETYSINSLRKSIKRNTYTEYDSNNNVLMSASSGMIWLTNTYRLYDGIPPLINSMFFEDLMQISQAAMEMELYATSIQFFLVASITRSKSKCMFLCDKRCRRYPLESLKTYYIEKHNYAHPNQSDAEFDSAIKFPFKLSGYGRLK